MRAVIVIGIIQGIIRIPRIGFDKGKSVLNKTASNSPIIN
jgi:hypothetical protein